MAHGSNSNRARRLRKQQRHGHRVRAAEALSSGPMLENLEQRMLLNAYSFANAAPITINDGVAATPYPSTVAVSGVVGNVSHVTVTLSGLSHTFTADLGVELSGPTGANTLVMYQAGGGNPVVGANLTFDDDAGGSAPSPIVSGTYQPSVNAYPTDHGVNGGAMFGPAPAPSGVHLLSNFDGLNPNGTWNLWVADLWASNTGAIAGGFSLDMTTDSLTYDVSAPGDHALTLRRNGAALEILDNGVVVNSQAYVDTNSVIINGGDASDTLTVDSSGGLIAVSDHIHFNGGAGVDTLVLSGGAADTDTYTAGPDTGSGQSVLVSGGSTQTIQFAGLEPIVDTVAAATLIVNGTDTANAITYIANPTDATLGRVSVDNQEYIDFKNKTALVINGGGGSDEISINNSATPTGLTGGITVNGNDPTASDTLIVNGVA
ncbi:MAG: hypothetical protein PHU85_15785, partial [Phycisphaerae bacterium]|nr:hypothetical protein [Phycisphaerae bacterium]